MPHRLRRAVETSLAERRTAIGDIIARHPLSDVVVTEIRGRQVKIDGRWFADFASCNYLGFDLEPEIIASIEPALQKWGVHPSWTRLVASPELYQQAEQGLAELIGAPATLILPTVTLVHMGVLPALLGKTGVALVDKSAHNSMYQAVTLARGRGASFESFETGDLGRLEQLLQQHVDNPRTLIVVDGPYSMTAAYADLPALCRLARQYNALVYVDDAHGFGVIGERPDAEQPYGRRGNGIVRHFDLDDAGIVYVGGLSKAYSSLAAFVAGPADVLTFLKSHASPFIFSGPCPTASLQSTLAGLALNAARGDELRARLLALTRRAVDGLRGLGFAVSGTTYFPIVSVWIGSQDRLVEAADIMYAGGVLPTICAYPLVRKGQESMRMSLTAANTEAEVDQLLEVFDAIAARYRGRGEALQPEEPA